MFTWINPLQLLKRASMNSSLSNLILFHPESSLGLPVLFTDLLDFVSHPVAHLSESFCFALHLLDVVLNEKDLIKSQLPWISHFPYEVKLSRKSDGVLNNEFSDSVESLHLQ